MTPENIAYWLTNADLGFATVQARHKGKEAEAQYNTEMCAFFKEDFGEDTTTEAMTAAFDIIEKDPYTEKFYKPRLK